MKADPREVNFILASAARIIEHETETMGALTGGREPETTTSRTGRDPQDAPMKRKPEPMGIPVVR